MRIGIIADVHCNYEALRIALDAMRDVDELLCAGDAVISSASRMR
jgi:predicted phosphodiesterase